jgi:hypothetical protein
MSDVKLAGKSLDICSKKACAAIADTVRPLISIILQAACGIAWEFPSLALFRNPAHATNAKSISFFPFYSPYAYRVPRF